MKFGSIVIVSTSILLCAMGATAIAQSTLKAESSAFAPNGSIPSVYTCSGSDKSPPLSWSKVQEAAKTLALIVEDPDAPSGNWIHWVIYDIPARTEGLTEDLAKTPTLPDGAKQGVNSSGRIGYSGPCPPPGAPHHYHFRLFALDSALGLKPGATAAEVRAAARTHIVAEGELVGVFGR